VRDYQQRQKLSGKKIVSFIKKNKYETVCTESHEKQNFIEV
jgi:hypothetical protein